MKSDQFPQSNSLQHEGSRLWKKLWKWGSLSLLLSVVIGTATWAVYQPPLSAPAKPSEAAEEPNPGLTGVLPELAPTDLSYDAFDRLGATAPKWQDWAEGMAEQVDNFYIEPGETIAEQRENLGAIRAKIEQMDVALGDPRYHRIHDDLITLKGRLNRRLDLLDAILDTLEMKPVQDSRVGNQLNKLLGPTLDLNNYLNTVNHGEAWKEWLQTEAVRQIATAKELTPEAISTLQVIYKKFADRYELDNVKQQQVLERPAPATYSQAIRRVLLAAGELGDETVSLHGVMTALVTAIEEYEETNTTESSELIQAIAGDLEILAPDGGQKILGVLGHYYMNYNLHFMTTENFFNRMAEQSDVNSGPVRDFVLGANVYGNQNTNTHVRVDVKPSYNGISFDILLSGQTFSNTVGVTHQANVYTQGTHLFNAHKSVHFDGWRFSTQPAVINITPNNRTVGAKTKLSWIPLLGGLTNKIAMDVARSKRPQANAIAASRLKDKALPEFNNQIEQQFAEAGNNLSELEAKLRADGLYPSALDVRSTSDHVIYSSRVMKKWADFGGERAPAMTVPSGGLLVQVHESLLNNGADQLGLRGQTMTEKQLVDHLEQRARRYLGNDFSFNNNTPQPVSQEEEAEKVELTFDFDERNPVRFRIEDGTITLTIRASLTVVEKRPGKEPKVTNVDDAKIGIELTPVLSGNVISVTPLVGVSGPDLVTSKVISDKITNELKIEPQDATVRLKREGQSDLLTYIRTLKMLNGWVSVTIE